LEIVIKIPPIWSIKRITEVVFDSIFLGFKNIDGDIVAIAWKVKDNSRALFNYFGTIWVDFVSNGAWRNGCAVLKLPARIQKPVTESIF
jgi:hypothetical protein